MAFAFYLACTTLAHRVWARLSKAVTVQCLPQVSDNVIDDTYPLFTYVHCSSMQIVVYPGLMLAAWARDVSGYVIRCVSRCVAHGTHTQAVTHACVSGCRVANGNIAD